MAETPTRKAAWGRLLRLPNLVTVPGDAAAGCFLAAGGRFSGAMFLAGACLLLIYMGGLLANDWFDREVDAMERPGRPLPSGEVAPEAVLAVALGASLLGMAPGFFLGPLAGLSVVGVAACALAYNAGAKRSAWLGAPLLGLCRGGGVWAGACFAGAPGSPLALAAAGTAFLYTTVVSGFAAGEAERPGYSPGLWALPGFWLAWAVLAALLQAGRAFPLWCIPVAAPALGFMDAALAVRAVKAGQAGVPALVGRCIRAMLWGQMFWFLWIIRSPGGLAAAAGIFLLARIVADALGRRFYGS